MILFKNELTIHIKDQCFQIGLFHVKHATQKQEEFHVSKITNKIHIKMMAQNTTCFKLLSKIKTIRHSKAFSDVKVEYNGKTHSYHKAILAIRSDYFRNTFQSFDSDRIDLSDSNFPPPILDAVFDTIYGEFEFQQVISWLQNGQPVDILYQAADYFQLDCLKELIESVLTNPALLHQLTLNSMDKIQMLVSSLKGFYIAMDTKHTAIFTNAIRKIAASDEYKNELYKLPGYFVKDLVHLSIDNVWEQEEFELFKAVWERMKVDGRNDEAEFIRNAIMDRFDFKYIDTPKALELCQDLDEARQIFSHSTTKMSHESRCPLLLINSNCGKNQYGPSIPSLSGKCHFIVDGQQHSITFATQDHYFVMSSSSRGDFKYRIVTNDVPYMTLFEGKIQQAVHAFGGSAQTRVCKVTEFKGDLPIYSYTLILKSELIVSNIEMLK
ncbi:hypothetical protein BC833DRAFT_652728 [Globomyces pollinis-pini]|nr:hypothetical protein BC833DRAFT_652728 [Globomyces pollinis-pini]